ncbi:PspC domain-containing protein [Flammeovirga pectinis]|uniref:PspC domain-containing protein n=1 Tax=Flammeovirga pectinis TaxID=2494373 RepID=A0A3Q9FND8_9BACT|nr:PspC domain-containing protein [Flammeovirga pectinis]AZQ62201.1 PspC domain-containing protein [Flammeovirga pectinis]
MVINNIHIGNSHFKATNEASAIVERYRSALNDHLSSFKNSSSIIRELEYKLSEILIPCIEDEFDYLTEDDVINAIEIVGTPNGFDLNRNSNTPQQPTHKKENYEDFISTLSEKVKSLYRDIDRQQIGGVAAGIADKFSIDPLWVRFIFILPFLLITTTKFPATVVSILYLSLWLFLPEKRNLSRDTNTRLFFRDSEKQVLGGVAGGLSNFIGIDVNIIRLFLLIALYFFHSVGILYIVLWVSTPFSRTLKDKFQSQGTPFNLSEIEKYLSSTFDKKNFNTEKLQKVYDKLNNIDIPHINASPLFKDLLRILSFVVGLFLFIGTIITIFLGVPVLGISLKIIHLTEVLSYLSNDLTNEVLNKYDANLLSTIQYSIPNTTATIGALHFVVTSTLLLIISSSMMTFQKLISNGKIFGLIGIDVILSLLLVTALNMSVHSFDNQAIHKEEVLLPLNNDILEITLDDIGKLPLNSASFSIEGHSGKDLKLIFSQEALGKTRERAINNAKAIDYTSNISDNKLLLSSHFSFPRGVKYRMQKLNVAIKVPFNKHFVIDNKLKSHINLEQLNTIEDGDVLIFDSNNLIQRFNETPKNNYSSSFTSSNNSKFIDEKTYEFPLDSIVLFGNLNIEIIIDSTSSKSSLVLYGEEKKEDNFKASYINNTLKIYRLSPTESPSKVLIKSPSLALIKFKGEGSLIIDKFKAKNFECKIDGNIKADVNVKTDKFKGSALGASFLILEGNTNSAFILSDGGSKINGEGFETLEVKAKAKGVSEVILNARNNATIFQSPLSKVTVLGNPVHLEKHTQR